MSAPFRRSQVWSIAWRTGLGVVILVAAAFGSQPWWAGRALGSYLSRTSGREVHFDSMRVGLTGTLEPMVVMRGVRIANSPWADSSQPFAELDEVVFHFAWRRYEDRWVIKRLVLRGGQVHLARRADGLRNWRLRDPEDRGQGHFWFEALEPHSASLRFTHEAVDFDLHTRATELAAAAATAEGGALVNRIDFDGRWRGVSFKGSADTGPELTFFDTGRWFPVRGHAEVAGARLEIDGRAADMFRLLQIDAAAVVGGDSLAALGPFIGKRVGDPRTFRAEGRLRADDAGYRFTAMRAKVGGTDLTGDLSWSRRGERRTVGAKLSSDATDLDDLLWLAGQGAAAPKNAARVVAAAAASQPSGRDTFAAARELDADLAFDARRIHVASIPLLQSVKLRARLDAGTLTVSDLDLGWGGGHSTGTLGLDLRQHPARAEAQVETRGIRVETLFAGADEKRRITGMLHSRARLKASGDDAATLRATVAGTVSMALSAGTIPSLLDAQMGLQGGKLMRTMLSGNEALALPCAAASADVSAGRVRVQSLVIESANTRTTGTGTLDLRDAAIDVVLTPEAKRPGMFELQKSIRLSGHLPRPDKALVDRVEPLQVADCTTAKP